VELIAAIDLVGGRATRLSQGDFDRPIHAGADPIELARAWVAAGVRRLHVVDLDGARAGRPVHGALIGRIAAEAHRAASDARVEASGGLRRRESVDAVLLAGSDAVILGSAAIADRGFLAGCAERWPDRIGAAIDLRDGRLSVDGWTRDVEGSLMAVAAQLIAAGASRLVVTDIQRDGTAIGPNVTLMAMLRERFPTATIVASGGIARPDELRTLAGLGIDGAIVGRALLDGSLSIPDALAACASETPV
jgi:phosphoribosylformimino-5-aminoimidazole carboxamide ribotide isomerase